MKNQGVWVTRIVMLAICAFVVAYMGYHVVSALTVPVRTQTAILYKTEETAAFSGLVVRDEAAIELPSGFMEFKVAEGEKVARSQVIAVTYPDSSAMRLNEDIRAVEARLEQLEYIASHSASSADATNLEGEIRESLAGIMSCAADGQVYAAREQALALKSSLFRREYAFGNLDGLPETIESLRLQAESLRQQASEASGQVRAPAAGVFSPNTDGLEETLTPQSMDGLTPEELESLLKRPQIAPVRDKGKLVYGMKWYLVTELPEDAAPAAGNRADMRFDGAFEHPMTVDSVDKGQGGVCRVVFSCAEELSRVVSSRRLSGEIILSQSEGIRVPKEAMRSDGEGTFVYCVVLSQVKRKPVTILHGVDRENFFLVEYRPGSSKNLLPGDEMIIAGKELYDGKVIR